jgi:hypothetical protein
MQKLNFQTQNLKIDFITLTVQHFDDERNILNLANYFHRSFGFNCFLSTGNYRRIVETLFQDLSTKDTLIIRKNYWKQTVFEFPGQSANKLYQLLKSHDIDWNSLQLSSLRLSRLDICYDQEKSFLFDPKKFDDFLIDSRRYIMENTKTENTKLITNSKGRILGINRRSNPRYYRIYEGRTQIRFELELKKQALSFVQDSFFKYQFDLFEYQLTKVYFRYSLTLFPSDNGFVGWLIHFYRKYIKSRRNSNSGLATEYFIQENNLVYGEHGQRLFHILQFLNFITKLESPKSSQYFILEGKRYIIEEFYLADFMKFIQIPSTNSRQRTKLVSYFKNLHNVNPIVEQFVDGSFRIFATFLYCGVNKVAGRLKVKIYIIEDLYDYAYPFIFSKRFINYTNRTDCLLKLQIMRCIAVQSAKKLFPLSEFLSQIKLSNSKLIQIKKDLIFLIQEIGQEGVIQDKIEIVAKHKRASVKYLNIDQLEVKHLNQRVAYLIFYEY